MDTLRLPPQRDFLLPPPQHRKQPGSSELGPKGQMPLPQAAGRFAFLLIVPKLSSGKKARLHPGALPGVGQGCLLPHLEHSLAGRPQSKRAASDFPALSAGASSRSGKSRHNGEITSLFPSPRASSYQHEVGLTSPCPSLSNSKSDSRWHHIL